MLFGGTMDNKTQLEAEWRVLQTSADQYEHKALTIKLVAIVLVAMALAISAQAPVTLLIVLVFWMTEAIYKTFQFRVFERLEQVESALSGECELKPYRFNLECSKSGGTKKTIVEYARSALRPTVAVTYVVLVGVIFINMV